jgi:broad specificity phosphatase PhoE
MDSLAAKSFWIMRHGRPDLPPNPFFMERAQFNHFLALYDEAALSEKETLRLRELYERFPHPDLVICSDLPRAHATADLFARGATVIADPLFREIPVWLPDTSTIFLNRRWPPEFWWSYLRLNWFRNQGPEGKDLARIRAEKAIARWWQYQHDYSRIAIVSHAGFISLLITMLHQQHQIRGPLLPSIRFGHPTFYHWVRSSDQDPG